jgi:2,3,4,5-tetrahydropyridine-2-carboxylate N-succinyltransferase
MNHPLQATITAAFAKIDQLNAANSPPELQQALQQIMGLLDNGDLRVAVPSDGQWHTEQWLKQAILLLFATSNNQVFDSGVLRCYDKIPLKFANYDELSFQTHQLRVVPAAVVRYGAYVAPNTVLMPCYINIGAYVASSCLIDTWATIGSCAQIGKNVHISGGVGIGGVLEPLQALPTIIEDDCFIGARSEIVEGVVVEQGAVIAMGVYLSQSTKIYNRATGAITYGRVPAGAVVVPGSLPSANGSYSLSCAVIVKQVDTKTQQKTAINELLRTCQ